MEEWKIPTHIAIIMDGNGRWAKKRKMPRSFGHQQGAKRLEELCRTAAEIGVKYLTVYAFSTENWTRSEDEITTLMKILRNYLADSIKKAKENNMRIRVLGDITRLDLDIQESIQRLEKVSAPNTGLNFQIALNYGSRNEMIRAVQQVVKDCQEGKIAVEELDETVFSSYLDTKGIPEIGRAHV